MSEITKQLDENNNKISEYNDLIRSMPYLSEYQYNVFKSILALIGAKDSSCDRCLYRLDIETFINIFKINSKSVYKKIKESLSDLQDKKLRKELMKDGIKGFVSSPLLGGFQYFEGQGYVEVEVPAYILSSRNL